MVYFNEEKIPLGQRITANQMLPESWLDRWAV
jgi:hypothetical protein